MQNTIKPHPLLAKFVKQINGLHLTAPFKEEHGIENYKPCWSMVRPIYKYDEVFRATLYLPVGPSYEPRRMHYPYLTVALTLDYDIRFIFHLVMRINDTVSILRLLRMLKREWVKELDKEINNETR